MAKGSMAALTDIMQMTEAYLTPAQVAQVLGCSGYAINVAARTPEGREALGFPVIKVGSRCKVPRVPFLRYMGITVEDTEEEEA